MLIDERPLRPGVMFADAELIGIPHVLVVGEPGLDSGVVDYRRRVEESEDITIADATVFIRTRLQGNDA